MHKLIVVVIVAMAIVACGAARAESEPQMPTEAQIIGELYDRIEALEERLAAQEAICEIVSVSSDFTTMTVRREVGGEEIDYEGVINTFTTYAGGGVQYQKLDAGDSVLVRFSGARAYTVALMPSIGDISEGVITRYDTANIANGTYSSDDRITNRVFGTNAEAESLTGFSGDNPFAQIESLKGSGTSLVQSYGRSIINGVDPVFLIRAQKGRLSTIRAASFTSTVSGNDPQAAAIVSRNIGGVSMRAENEAVIQSSGPRSDMRVNADLTNGNVETHIDGNNPTTTISAAQYDNLGRLRSVSLTITHNGATLTRTDEADSSNDRTINLFTALSP